MRLFFLSILMLTTACGYQPIFYGENKSINIGQIESNQENVIFFKIKNNLKRYQSNTNSEELINVYLDIDDKISITSKDNKGNPKTYEINVSVEITVEENKVIIGKKKFEEKFGYPKDNNKFNQRKYEKSLINDLTNKIIEDLNNYLFNLRA